MMNVAEIFFSKTAAYRAVLREKQAGKISHSYLLVSSDDDLSRAYLKALAKLIMCEKGGICGDCRACRLIEKEAYADCDIYPAVGEKITAEGIDIIVSEKCYVKPLEADLKVFAICGAEKMNLPAQNKLLKTLEEPPKNVCILLGAVGDHALLPTVKSRVKRLEIPIFSPMETFNVLKDYYPDEERLKKVCALADGRVGAVEALYNDENAFSAVSECVDMLLKIKKSPDIARYSAIIAKKSREDLAKFIAAMRIVVRDLLFIKHGLSAQIINADMLPSLEMISEKYKGGALIAFSDVLNSASAANENFSNQTMLADRMLFALLEENYRWQKL